MYERRHSAASLVSLLVVTQFFLWACSSSDHEETAVTTSGGAGSTPLRGGAPASEGESTSVPGASGTVEIDLPVSLGDGGTGHESSSAGSAPSAGSDAAMAGGGTSSELDPPQANGGTIAIGAAGESSAGTSAGTDDSGAGGFAEPTAGAPGAGGTSAGGAAVGGAAAESEPVCDPADDHSTSDMFLPCAVSTALYVCRNCHSNPPVKGAFSSYVTYADIKANSAKIYGVIKSGVMPRPPYTMSAWQKTTALNWLGKDGSCAIGATVSCQ